MNPTIITRCRAVKTTIPFAEWRSILRKPRRALHIKAPLSTSAARAVPQSSGQHQKNTRRVIRIRLPPRRMRRPRRKANTPAPCIRRSDKGAGKLPEVRHGAGNGDRHRTPKRTEYTCPMHPQIVRDAPGSCPICGMALEPREVTAEETNPELADMTRRLWISVALAAPMLALMVSAFLPSMPMQHLFSARVWAWIEFALATPVVLWCGLPFFVRGWQSVEHRSLNMFTLIALVPARPISTASSLPSFRRSFRLRFVGAEDRSMCTSSLPRSLSPWFFWAR